MSSKPTGIVRENGISATYNLINFLNGMIGPGCFSIAMAFQQGGLWTVFFLVFFIGAVSTFSMHKIVDCSQKLAISLGDAFLDYGDMAQAAMRSSHPSLRSLALPAKILVNSFLTAFQIGVTSVSYIFVVDHIEEVLTSFNVVDPFTTTQLLLLYAIPATAINLVRTIRTITFICLVGNIFLLVAMLIIIYELMTASHNHWQSLPWITSFDGVILCTGSLLYSFEGQALVLPLENRLRHPEDMKGVTGVLTTGMMLVSIVYCYNGFFGYITYGKDVQGSITLNLPDTTMNIVVKCSLVLVVFFGNVLQVYIIIETLWPSIKKQLVKRCWKNYAISIAEYALRIFTVWFAISLAVLVPNLSSIIPLIGISCGMTLSFIIPGFLHLAVFLPDFLTEVPHDKPSDNWISERKVSEKEDLRRVNQKSIDRTEDSISTISYNTTHSEKTSVIDSNVKKNEKKPEMKLRWSYKLVQCIVGDVFLIVLGFFFLVSGLQSNIENLEGKS